MDKTYQRIRITRNKDTLVSCVIVNMIPSEPVSSNSNQQEGLTRPGRLDEPVYLSDSDLAWMDRVGSGPRSPESNPSPCHSLVLSLR